MTPSRSETEPPIILIPKPTCVPGMQVYIPHVLRNTLGNSTPTRTLTLYFTQCVRYHTTRKVTHPLGGRISKLPPPPDNWDSGADAEQCVCGKVSAISLQSHHFRCCCVLRSVRKNSALKLFPSIGLVVLPSVLHYYTVCRWYTACFQ